MVDSSNPEIKIRFLSLSGISKIQVMWVANIINHKLTDYFCKKGNKSV